MFKLEACRKLAILVCVLPLMWSPTAHAQTFSVIHNFTGGGDGAVPYFGMTLDRAGNLYGTTLYGGVPGACEGVGCGVVFKMSQHNSHWTFTPLYSFSGGSDGAVPFARVVFGPNGSLYGSTYAGGNGTFPSGTGVIFNLQPPAHASSHVLEPWVETVLYAFGNTFDGNSPSGDLVFDPAGNIYGTTITGGYECADTVYCGTVFELAHNGSSWSESLLYVFTDENVATPWSGVIFDQAGNLFGTTTNGLGAIFQLVPSGGGWTENTIHYFGGSDGYGPAGGLILDPSGTLYGATAGGGANGNGTLYRLVRLGDGWAATSLFAFTSTGPGWTLTKDAAGNYYGTNCEGGSHNSGSVFKLTPSGGTWVQTLLYEFTGGSDGYCPILSGVALDATGNLYGSAWAGGAYGDGVVWQITP